MKGGVIGLFQPVWGSGEGGDMAGGRNVFARYRKGVAIKANPRAERYMRELFERGYPDGEFIRVDKQGGWPARVAEADKVVLLYPDAIGLGFGPLERQVWRRKMSRATVVVLNGRGRQFRLSNVAILGLWLRRMLEKIMVIETVAMFLFIVLTPFLLFVDLLKGRR